LGAYVLRLLIDSTQQKGEEMKKAGNLLVIVGFAFLVFVPFSENLAGILSVIGFIMLISGFILYYVGVSKLTKSRQILTDTSFNKDILGVREILGKNNVFGPEDWSRYFPNFWKESGINLEQVNQIPWSRNELKELPAGKFHFLFLGVDKFYNGPCDLLNIYSLFTLMTNHPKLTKNGALFQESYIKTKCNFQWYLIQYDIVSLPDGLFDEPTRIPEGYEPTNTIERVMANILFFKLNNQYLDRFFVRTSDTGFLGMSIQGSVCLQGTPGLGILLSNENIASQQYIKYALKKKMK
jgi:hypothetical protein